MVNVRRYNPGKNVVDALSSYLDYVTNDIMNNVEIPPDVAAVSAIKVTKGLLETIEESLTKNLELNVTSVTEDPNDETVH